MIFFWSETPDGWCIPGIHGVSVEDGHEGYTHSGVYLIRGRDENLLLDTGNWTGSELANGMGERLVELLDGERNALRYIFLTHFHYDHVGNAAMLKARYGATVVCHPADRPVIEDPLFVTRPESLARLGTTPEDFLRDFNLQDGESLGWANPDVIRKYWNRPVEVDETIDDGGILECGGLRLEAVHLPGHTPGHTGLYNPQSRTLYSADLFHYPTPLGPHPFGDARAHYASIQRCLEINPAFLFEGHGLSTYAQGPSRRRLLHIRQRQDDTRDRIRFVLQREGRAMTTEELAPEVAPVRSEYDYPVPTGIGQRRSYVEFCIQTHLVWMIELGTVERIEEGGLIKFRPRT